MKYTDDQLDEAVKLEIFQDYQVERFRAYARNNSFQITKPQKTLYYGGGLLIISAMTWLMKTSWDSFGPAGITFISALYMLVFLIVGLLVFFKLNMETAGGILCSVPIAVTPLFVFSLLRLFDFWPGSSSYNDYYIWIKGKWIILELSVIAAALPIFIKTKFPFHLFLIAGSLWFLSMDIVPILYRETGITWSARANISKWFGLCMILAGYFADVKFKKDYSAWLYLFGLLTLITGLSVFYNREVWSFIVLGAANVMFIVFALFVNRNVFLVFGTTGLIELLGRLSWVFFQDSPLFPFALTAIGAALIFTGIFFQRNRKSIEKKFSALLPEYLTKLRPRRD